MPICDNCGHRMDVMDDDSLYCPYCGATSGPDWIVWTDNGDPDFDLVMQEEP